MLFLQLSSVLHVMLMSCQVTPLSRYHATVMCIYQSDVTVSYNHIAFMLFLQVTSLSRYHVTVILGPILDFITQYWLPQ